MIFHLPEPSEQITMETIKIKIYLVNVWLPIDHTPVCISTYCFPPGTPFTNMDEL